ncbi:MAG: hypothetical protein JO004_05020 [Methylobacteriaceae bacterium]|nr:hypothetical protein [Methylobacteriaceae bacterium]
MNRVIEVVQRTAMAMQSIQERLRRTESSAMEFIHIAQKQLAASDEKLARSEAKVQELQKRISELENALRASDQRLAEEKEHHQHSTEWLAFLQEQVVGRLGPTVTFLDDLNSNPGPLLGMLEAKAVKQLNSAGSESNSPDGVAA